MKVGLNLKIGQSLALTPQLQQAIKLLQLSSLELQQELQAMLQENPFLELDEDEPPDAAAPEASASLADTSDTADSGDGFEAEPERNAADGPDDWSGDGSLDTTVVADEWGDDAPLGLTPGAEADDFDPMTLRAAHESLQDYLHHQALGLGGSAADRQAVYFLIESLNDDGYLEDSLVSLAQSISGSTDEADFDALEELLDQLKIALKLLQSLEPAGVGARDLAECLKLQLLQLPESEMRRAALRICASSLHLLAKKDVRALLPICDASEEVVRAAMQQIARLEPKPGRRFAQVERHIIVPDVIVTAKGQGKSTEFLVQINPEIVPRVRVHQAYAQALKDGKGGDKAQQSLNDARNFVRNIQQRFDTILRTATVIVERQRSFFLHGAVSMKPLILREVADALEMHESTISRVTTNKYMATPQGTFEFKHFFGSSLGTQNGGSTSSTAVRALLRQLIEAEEKSKPLSDHALAELLSAQGIDCARRTVAKYREAMRIPPASLRKET